MSDKDGSDPSVIRKLHQDENAFPAHEFDGKGDDPLSKVKNQVRRSTTASFSQLDGLACPGRHLGYTNLSAFDGVQVQLSCYGDAIGGDLKNLKTFLDTKVDGESTVAHRITHRSSNLRWVSFKLLQSTRSLLCCTVCMHAHQVA